MNILKTNKYIMKTILILILASLPLIGAAQIDIQLSFNKEAKEATLLLLNTSDNIYRLSPKSIDQYEPGTGCIYTFLYRDKNDKVIYKRSRFIYDELPLAKYRLRQYLLPHANNEYKYEFAKWYSGEICSIEVEIQIEAINYTTRKSYLKKIKRISYLK